VTVQVEWLESREEISARDFNEFRTKTMALYQSSVRSVSLPPSDPDCRFIYPGLEQPGRWFGPCRDGLAWSRGYGLILDGRGNVVEFLGSAESGLASGTGAMIVRDRGKMGAIYFEGDFNEGLPDGVVRVETPGRQPRVRQFRAGEDSGPAEADQLQPVRF